MAKNIIIWGFFILSSFSSLYSVGERSSNTSGRDEGARYSVVFEGVLTTQEGHVYKVNEINFNKLIKQIPVFEMPSLDSYEKHDKNSNILKKNPAERLEITKLDLSEISMIAVPFPDVLWYYKKNQLSNAACPIECSGTEPRYKIADDPRASKYIQIQITDKEGKKEDYLVESNKKIYCSEITASGPREKDVQLRAVKTLTITGYRKREEEEEEKEISSKTRERKEEVRVSVLEGPLAPHLINKNADTLKTSNKTKRIRSTKIVRVS